MPRFSLLRAGSTSAPLRLRQHAHLKSIESRHVVFLGPERDMAVLPACALKGGEQRLLVQGNREVVVIERHAQGVPAIRHDVGLRAIHTRGLAVREQDEVDALLEGVGADRVVAVRITQAHRKARGQRRPRDHLQADLDLDVLSGDRPVDRERISVLMLICAHVLDGKAVGRGGIAHQRPLSEIALPGALKVEVGGGRSDRTLRNVAFRGGILGRKAAACQAHERHHDKAGQPCAHERAPAKKRSRPALLHPMSVVIIPILKRKIAMMAATDRASAHGLTLLNRGASNANGKKRIGSTSLNTAWIANQTARFSTTPTTAAVIADKAPLRALLPRSASMNGAPRKIQRKEGMNVTQVASKPPSVPASMGGSEPASRKAAMNPTNWSTMINGPGVVSAMPRPSSISPGLTQP